MKLKLMAIIAAIVITGSASAQNVNIGIKGGLNLYNIKNDNNFEADQKVGFNLGLLGHIHLSDQWALQPEIVYSTQGAKYKTSDGTTELNLDYINIPILFQYMFDNGFRIQAGPQLGILAKAKAKDDNNSTDVKDGFEGTDIGLSFGVSYVHPPTGFGIDGRYNMGLTNINDGGSVESMNRGVQLGVFYLFNHRQ